MRLYTDVGVLRNASRGGIYSASMRNIEVAAAIVILLCTLEAVSGQPRQEQTATQTPPPQPETAAIYVGGAVTGSCRVEYTTAENARAKKGIKVRG